MKKTVLNFKTLFPIAWHSLRWHVKFFATGKGFPLAGGIFLTNQCNLRCHMCSIWADKRKATLGLPQVREIVDACTPGLCYLSFSGGEPLLVKELMDMAAYASKKVPYTHLVTNGLLLDDAAARELARAGLSEISISLDGNREWHNRLRNSEKSFDAVLSAIESVKRAAPGIKITVNTVIFPDNVDQAREAVRLTGELKVLHKLQPVNRHFLFEESAAGQYRINFKDAALPEIRKFVRELKADERVVNSGLYLDKIPDYFGQKLSCPMIKPRCLLPHFFIEANAYGKVSPCMIATGWDKGRPVGPGLRETLASPGYEAEKKALEPCRKCDSTMYICYWEPMAAFPISHFLKYSLF